MRTWLLAAPLPVRCALGIAEWGRGGAREGEGGEGEGGEAEGGEPSEEGEEEGGGGEPVLQFDGDPRDPGCAAALAGARAAIFNALAQPWAQQ